MFFQQCLHFAKDQLSLERGKSACVYAVPDPEKAASGQSLTQYLSHFCNTTLFQYSLKYSGFINPFRTTCCSPKGMKPAAVSILPYENLTQQLKLWDCSLQLLWATFFFLWHALNIPSMAKGLAGDFQWNFCVLDNQVLLNFSRSGSLSPTKLFWHFQTKRMHSANYISRKHNSNQRGKLVNKSLQKSLENKHKHHPS